MRSSKVFVTNTEIPEAGLKLLREKCELIVNEEVVATRNGILANVQGVDAIFWESSQQLNKQIIDAAGPQLKVIGTMSAGINHIDVSELKARGIKLGNTSGVLSDAVAEVAILLALAAARRLQEGRRCIEHGTCALSVQWMLGRDISGSTVGIVGLGAIGQAILKKIVPFGVSRFIYSGNKEKGEGKRLGAEFVPFDTLLTESDFVIVSCPLTPGTTDLFNDDAFSKMKKTAIFVNVARGRIVDQPALVRALQQGKIFAAGLDVATTEPIPKDDVLLSLSNCVLMPHLGSATVNTRNAMAELTAQNILRGLDGIEMLSPVI